MLDNFDGPSLKVAAAALKARHPHVLIEGSGGITEENLATYFSPRASASVVRMHHRRRAPLLTAGTGVLCTRGRRGAPWGSGGIRWARHRRRRSQPGLLVPVRAARGLFAQNPAILAPAPSRATGSRTRAPAPQPGRISGKRRMQPFTQLPYTNKTRGDAWAPQAAHATCGQRAGEERYSYTTGEPCHRSLEKAGGGGHEGVDGGESAVQ